MAKRELRRKIIATVLTVTMLCALLCVCAWLLLSSDIFNSTIHTMMLLCTAVLGIATIGLLVAKIQEIRALREIVRNEEMEQQAQTAPPVQHAELEPLQSLDHKTIELPALTDIPLGGNEQNIPEKQPSKSIFGRRNRDTMKQPAAETLAQAVEVVPPTPVAAPAEPAAEPKWKPIDFGAALKARENEEQMARRRAEEAQLARQRRAEEEARRLEEERLAELARAEQQVKEEEAAKLAQLDAEINSAAAEEAAPAIENEAAETVLDTPAENAPVSHEITFDEAIAEPTDEEPVRKIAEEEQPAEPKAVLAPEEPKVPDEEPAVPCAPQQNGVETEISFDVDAAHAAHLQAIRHVQEARRSAEAKAAEEEQLAEVARKAEAQRTAANTQPAPPVVNEMRYTDAPLATQEIEKAEPLDSGLWESWQPNAVHFNHSVQEQVPAAKEAPAAVSFAEEEQPAPAEKKKRGFFGLFKRRKAEKPVEKEVIPAPEPAAPAAEPVVPMQPEVPAEEPAPAPVKLNVKPIAWPAPPPPSRNFVHPPQSTMQFSAITPEQIAQIQAEAQRQKAQHLAAQRQAARNAVTQQNRPVPPANRQDPDQQ